MSDTGICHTCKKTHPWPDGRMPRHPFNPTGDVSMFDKAPVVVQEAPWPFDPVLRQALIDKGVLTPQDLIDAEAKIRAVTGRMMGNDSESTAASRS